MTEPHTPIDLDEPEEGQPFKLCALGPWQMTVRVTLEDQGGQQHGSLDVPPGQLVVFYQPEEA